MHFPHVHASSYFTSYVENDWKIIYHYSTSMKKNKKKDMSTKAKIELFNLANDLSKSNDLGKFTI